MDTDLSIKLTEIVEKIGDIKTELTEKIGECKTEIGIVKTNLKNHLENEEKKNNKKERRFDKKTVIFGILLGVVGLIAAFN